MNDLECYKHNSKCLQNAKEDEPIFVLRAQDITSPLIIIEWIIANFRSCPEEKLRKAFETALAMRKYPIQFTKPAD